MHKTLVFVIFPLHSSIFHHRTERFVKFDTVLHHDTCCFFSEAQKYSNLIKCSSLLVGKKKTENFLSDFDYIFQLEIILYIRTDAFINK